MKSKFSGFYTLTKEEFKVLWDRSTFVFDTNTLLNLYRYDKETRDLLFKVMDFIKDRIWIPHQIALEYHKHMFDEIYNQESAYESINEKVSSAVKTLENELKELRHSNINVEKVTKLLDDLRENTKKELESQKESQPDLGQIKNRIIDLFDNKVGEEYSQEELNEIYIDGSYRYDNKIPPGYKDAKEKENKKTIHNKLVYHDMYGDLIFWKQILDKSIEKDINSIILVTDDNKEDWILKIKGKKKGPQPELIHEFKKESGGKLFYLYNTEQFLKFAKEYLDLPDASLNTAKIDKAIENVKTTKELLNELQGAIVVESDVYKNGEIRQRKLVLFGYMAILRVYEENESHHAIATTFIKGLRRLTGGEFVIHNVLLYAKDEIHVHFRSSEVIGEDIVEDVNKTLASSSLLFSKGIFRVLELFKFDFKSLEQ